MNVIQNAARFLHKVAWLHNLRSELAHQEDQNGLSSQMHPDLELELWDKVIPFQKLLMNIKKENIELKEQRRKAKPRKVIKTGTTTLPWV